MSTVARAPENTDGHGSAPEPTSAVARGRANHADRAGTPGRFRRLLRSNGALVTATLAVLVLAVISTFVGVADVTPVTLMRQVAGGDTAGLQESFHLLSVSRFPRTISVILAGMAMAVAGLIMQQMARNKFVEPSTVGTVESASLGLLAVTVLIPSAPLLGKMGVAAVFAVGGTALFLAVLQKIPLRNALLVPLVGIMLGNVIAAITTFFAYRFNLLQTLNTWMIGDFSGVIKGRYELLWIVAALTLIGYIAADRFTVAGMGQDVSTTLGVNYKRIMALGMTIVALISAVVVVAIGSIPFLGLVVPNIVSLMIGDNMRRSVPWVGVFGAGFVLVCDIVGRVIRYPFEIPVGTVVAVVGAAIFLTMLLRKRARS